MIIVVFAERSKRNIFIPFNPFLPFIHREYFNHYQPLRHNGKEISTQGGGEGKEAEKARKLQAVLGEQDVVVADIETKKAQAEAKQQEYSKPTPGTTDPPLPRNASALQVQVRPGKSRTARKTAQKRAQEVALSRS